MTPRLCAPSLLYITTRRLPASLIDCTLALPPNRPTAAQLPRHSLKSRLPNRCFPPQGFGWAIAKALAEAGAEISLGVWVPALNIFETSYRRGERHVLYSCFRSRCVPRS